MGLPNMPYLQRIINRDIVEFRGLDRTDGAPMGALSDALNLSTIRYPVLSPRCARTPLTQEWLDGAQDMCSWGDEIVSCKDGRLYVGGTDVCAVSEGRHQFAAVSGRLIVMPDKLIIERTEGGYAVESMDADVSIGGVPGGLTLKSNSLTAPIYPKTGVGKSALYTGDSRPSAWIPATYAYGDDLDAVSACWHDGAWDTDALAEIGQLVGVLNYDGSHGVDRQIRAGDIIIPDGSSWSLISANKLNGDLPDISQYNSEGIVGVITHADPNDYSISDSRVMWHFDLIKIDMGTPILSCLFSTNDAVSISGTPADISDIEHVIVRGMDAKTNSLLFDDNALVVPDGYAVTLVTLPEGEQQRLRWGGKDGLFTPTDDVLDGSALYAYNVMDRVYVTRDGALVADYPLTDVGDTPEEDPPDAIALVSYAAALDASPISVRRDVPALAYVCESGNRLWGVSNEDNTILVSALGDPRNFFVFDGVDTDSYQLAVGSDGEWTGIIAYGGGVCCWKEHTLHKILGSYPSEYYSAEYKIEGVGHGCDRSLTVINDVLYYSGASGVYAYTGGTPSRIGDGISPSPMYPPSDTVGGTDGRHWYLSGVNWRDKSELMVYDTSTGLWVKEDDTLAVAMIYHNYRVHVLDSEGNVWRVEPQTWNADTPWMAEFVPFDETRAGGGMPVLRKYYMRLDLRLDMSAGSTIKAEVQEDGGAWRTVMDTDATADVAKRVAILPRRCDRFAVRLSGKGYVVLRAMTREFLAGSERV